MKKIIAISLTVVAVLAVSNYLTHKLAFSAGDSNGYNRAIGEYSAQAAALAQEAMEEQARRDKAAQAQISAMHTALTAERLERERIQHDRRSKPTIQACDDSSGRAIAVLTGDAVRVLEQTRYNPALPEAANLRGVAGAKNHATADDLEAYCRYAISEYNQCAIERNTLTGILKDYPLTE